MTAPIGSRWKNVHTGHVMEVTAVEDELRTYRYDQAQFFHRVGDERDFCDDIERRFVSLDAGLSDEEVIAAIAERRRTRKNQDGVGVLMPHPWAIRKLGRKAADSLVANRLTLASADELNDLRLLEVDYLGFRSARAALRRLGEDILYEKRRVSLLDEQLGELVQARTGRCRDCGRVLAPTAVDTMGLLPPSEMEALLREENEALRAELRRALK